MPTTLEALVVVAYFVVPGYLFLSAYSAVQIREPRSDARAIVEYIAASMAFWVVLSPAVLAAGETHAYVNHRLGCWQLLSLTSLVVPSLAGYALAKNGRLFNRPAGMRPLAPTAWDYHLGGKQNYFVLVTLTSGDRIAGW